MRVAFLWLVITTGTWAQTSPPPSPNQETSGKCSSAVAGNSNRVTINCNGVTQAQGDELLKILNTVLRKQLDPAVVLTKLDEIQTGVSYIKGQLAEQQHENNEAERLRRTAPEIDPYLVAAENGKVYLYMRSKNLIPFQFHYFIVKSNNDVVGGFPIGDQTVYPTQSTALHYVPKDIDLDQIADHYIELRFWFKSLSDDELHLPGHDGEIIRKYKITQDGKLSEIP
jgi:hypothetical protein